MQKNKTESTHNGAVVIGTMSLAAAAVGAFWLYGAKNAAKHRKSVSSWMLHARAEVMEAVEKVKDMDKNSYLKIVDDVVGKYSKTKSAAQVIAIAKEIKSAWPQISAITKPVKKTVKKAVKKVTKNV